MGSKVEVEVEVEVNVRIVKQMSKTMKVKMKGYFLSFNRLSTEIAILEDQELCLQYLCNVC